MYANHRGRAFSTAETLISLVLVSGLLVVSFDTFGAAASAHRLTAHRAQAHLLATARISEIMQKEYKDPTGPVVFGLEADELLLASTDFDDVDDFHGLVEALDLSTPSAAWVRLTRVTLASANDPQQSSLTDQGAKRINVEVRLNGRVLASITAVRTGDVTMDLEPILIE
jgi:hypothetical protein